MLAIRGYKNLTLYGVHAEAQDRVSHSNQSCDYGSRNEFMGLSSVPSGLARCIEYDHPRNCEFILNSIHRRRPIDIIDATISTAASMQDYLAGGQLALCGSIGRICVIVCSSGKIRSITENPRWHRRAVTALNRLTTGQVSCVWRSNRPS